jgi:hypothetical protein
MRTFTPRPVSRHASLAVWTIAAALASGASAEPLDEPSRGWEPAFSVGFDVQNQGFETSVDSDPLVFDSDTGTYNDGLGVFGSESTTLLSSVFRFDGAFYTPSIIAGGGAPRLFVHAGALVPLSEDFAALRENQEFLATNPIIRFAPYNSFCPTGPNRDVVDGKPVVSCDHAATADVNYDISWYAGLGVEFTLPIGQRRFRLRPSVDYFGQPLRFDGSVTRVDRTEQNPNLDPPTVAGEIIREPTVSVSASELVHALGPRLTLDVEVARLGAFSLNPFLEAQLYWILSERDFTFRGQSADGSADFRVKLRPLIAQGGAGLRVVWRGD